MLVFLESLFQINSAISKNKALETHAARLTLADTVGLRNAPSHHAQARARLHQGRVFTDTKKLVRPNPGISL